jgi:hypothetical protein
VNKWWIPAVTALALLNGCASQTRSAIPVVDSGSRVSNGERVSSNRNNTYRAPVQTPSQSQAIQEDSGVTVMVPGGANASGAPISTFVPPASAPISIPSASSGGLSEDEQLDGPVLALLTTAQQQQSGGDLNGAASSLERAQRVAPREPQVLYRLAQVRLAQGDAPQAEQLARRGLTYANGRASLQASLWGLIAQSREKQGDAAGAALARQKANG